MGSSTSTFHFVIAIAANISAIIAIIAAIQATRLAARARELDSELNAIRHSSRAAAALEADKSLRNFLV